MYSKLSTFFDQVPAYYNWDFFQPETVSPKLSYSI